jgi:hypothetical protein
VAASAFASNSYTVPQGPNIKLLITRMGSKLAGRPLGMLVLLAMNETDDRVCGPFMNGL